ncbi:MAG: elongation factor G [Bacteroidota bacterium]
MKEYTTDHVRNIALIGHGGSGKTSIAEALLYTAGMTSRQGKVTEGNTVSDYHPDEIERQISINTSMLFCEWKDTKLNILDTPGYTDFLGEVKGALRVADTALVVLKAVEGAEVGTEMDWKCAEEYQNCAVFVVNKLDNENADFDSVVKQAQERFSHDVIAVQFPADQGLGFEQVVDVLRMKLLQYQRDGNGKYTEQDIPQSSEGSGLNSKAKQLREQLIEKIAESDEPLLNEFLLKGTLGDDLLKKGLRAGIVQRKVFPILCASAAHNIGTAALLDFLVDYCPMAAARGEAVGTVGVNHGAERKEVRVKPDPNGSPSLFVFKTMSEHHVGELSFFRVYSGTVHPGMDLINTSIGKSERFGQVFVINGKERKEVARLLAGDLGAGVKLKDTHTNNTLSSKDFPVLYPPIQLPPPAIRVAIVPRSKGDEEKIAAGLHTLHEEDPTFLVSVDPELNQTIISGQGELHLMIIVKRLRERYGVEVDIAEPRIPYRETIKGVVEDSEYKHKKQTGGRGQFGHVHLKLERLPHGSGFEFENEIVGGAVPGRFVPAVEKGVVEAMQKGVLAGYRVVDVRVTLWDGSYHTVDSDELSFKIAGLMAFKKGFLEARPTLLEPINELEVIVPEDYMGDVMGDISSRRGKILGMESDGFYQKIKALVPLAEIHKYSTVLRSMTQGRGHFTTKFFHYEEVPREIQEKVIAAAQKQREAAA